MKDVYELAARQAQQEAFGQDLKQFSDSLRLLREGAALMDQGLEKLGIDRQRLGELVHEVFPGNGRIETASADTIEDTTVIAAPSTPDSNGVAKVEQGSLQEYSFPALQEIFPDFDPNRKQVPGQRRAMTYVEIVRPNSTGTNWEHGSAAGSSMVKAVYRERFLDPTDPDIGRYLKSLSGPIYNNTKKDNELEKIAKREVDPKPDTAQTFAIIRHVYAPFYDGIPNQDLARLIRREIPFPALVASNDDTRTSEVHEGNGYSHITITGDLIEGVPLVVPESTSTVGNGKSASESIPNSKRKPVFEFSDGARLALPGEASVMVMRALSEGPKTTDEICIAIWGFSSVIKRKQATYLLKRLGNVLRKGSQWRIESTEVGVRDKMKGIKSTHQLVKTDLQPERTISSAPSRTASKPRGYVQPRITRPPRPTPAVRQTSKPLTHGITHTPQPARQEPLEWWERLEETRELDSIETFGPIPELQGFTRDQENLLEIIFTQNQERTDFKFPGEDEIVQEAYSGDLQGLERDEYEAMIARLRTRYRNEVAEIASKLRRSLWNPKRPVSIEGFLNRLDRYPTFAGVMIDHLILAIKRDPTYKDVIPFKKPTAA